MKSVTTHVLAGMELLSGEQARNAFLVLTLHILATPCCEIPWDTMLCFCPPAVRM